MGDAAKQAKAPYCTESQNVNSEVAWTESVYTYPERSANDYSFTAEVSRGHSKLETSCTPEREGQMQRTHKRMKG